MKLNHRNGYAYGKRFFDLALSGLALLAFSPLFLLLALLISRTSPGPVFFRQKRAGKDKKLFTMLKFRTMRTDAPAETPTHLLKDPYAYITKTGRFLRKTSLDELPQLWNILVGEMSIVGPRPALWNQDDLLAERDKYGANQIRPGLTGLAQVRGRDEIPVAQKAAFDGEYYREMCFSLDCRIIRRTFLHVFTGIGVSEGGPSHE